MEIEKKVLIAIDLNFETGFILSKAASFFRDVSAKFYILHVIYSDIFTLLIKNPRQNPKQTKHMN
jgi:hypothetical protein